MNESGRQGKLGVFTLIFFVVAAASPLTGFVGGIPLVIGIGNGAGAPGAYLLAGLILLLFSIGFIAMSPYVKNAGAFYSYISLGIGRKAGVSGLGLAILTYVAIYMAVAAMFGLFTHLFFAQYAHLDLPWWVYSMALVVVVSWLGIERVEISGRVLGTLMILEIGIALIIALAAASHGVAERPVSLASFAPSAIFQGNIGVALALSLAAFIGFESTAIYAEECRRPARTIPLATLASVLLVTLFFAFCSWSLVQVYGAANIQAAAAADMDNFIFNVATSYYGAWIAVVMNLLLITSLFAATQSFHNDISRYFYAMAKDGLFWNPLSKLHKTKQTPYISSICEAIFMLLLLAVFAVGQFDPMADVFTWGSALASMSIIVLEIYVSWAVICYFKRHHELHARRVQVTFIPALSIISMLGALYLMFSDLHGVSGIASNAVYFVPFVIALAIVGGYGYACIFARFRPEALANLD